MLSAERNALVRGEGHSVLTAIESQEWAEYQLGVHRQTQSLC